MVLEKTLESPLDCKEIQSVHSEGDEPWDFFGRNDAKELERNFIVLGFPGGSAGKESACNAGDLGSIPGLGRSPGEENGKPRQYSCLENSMDRGAWRDTVHGVARVRHNLVTKPTSHQSCCH